MQEFNIKKRIESYNKTIRLPEDIIDKVEKIAHDNDISFNKVILEMIKFSLDNMKK